MQRKILKEEYYDFCGENVSLGHILWSCKIVKETWSEVGLNCNISPSTPKEFLDVLWIMMDSQGEKDWELFAIVAWCLWNNRNKVRHGGARKIGKSIAEKARKCHAEVRTALPSNGRPSRPKIIHKQWSLPP